MTDTRNALLAAPDAGAEGHGATRPSQPLTQPASGPRARLRAGTAWLRTTALGVGGLSLVVAITGFNLSNFAFHVVISRTMGPARYGELSALLNVVVVLAIPLSALQAAVAQAVAERSSGQPGFGVGRLARQATLAGLAGAAIWAAVVVPVDRLLRLPAALPALSLSVWIALTVVASVLQGVLMGQRRFRPVAAAQLLGGGLVRLVSAIVLVGLGFGVTGAIAATPIAAAVSLVILLVACRRELRAGAQLLVAGADALRSVAALGGATLLTSMDAWLARHFLTSTDAGYFAAASTAGRISLFLPAAITTVIFPAMATTGGRGPAAMRALRRAVLLVGAVSLASVAVLAAAPRLVTGVLFGGSFAEAASVLPVVALADAGIAVVSLLVYFFLTRRSRWSLLGWAACALAMILGEAFHGSIRALAYDMLVANLLTAGVLGVVAATVLAADRRSELTTSTPPSTPTGPRARRWRHRLEGRRRLRSLGRQARPAGLGLGAAGAAAIAVLLATDGNVASRFLAGFAVATLTAATALAALTLLTGSEGGDPSPAPSARPSRASWLGLWLVVAVAGLAAQSWFVVGRVLAGGDIAPPTGTAWVGQLLAPWRWSGSNLGGPSGIATQLPWAVILEVVHGVGGTSGQAQRLWLTALFAGAGAAAYVLLRVIGFRVVPCVIGALVVLFNADVVSEVGINSVFLASLLLMSALPALVIAVGRGLVSVRQGVVGLVASAPLLGFSYANPPLLVFIFVASMLGVIATPVLSGRAGLRRVARFVLLAAPLLAMASLYWIVPNLVATTAAATTQLSSTSSWAWTEGRSTLANGLWLNTAWGWAYSEYFPFAPGYASFPLAAVRYLLPLTAFAAVPLCLRRCAGTLARGVALVTVGAAGAALVLILLATGTRSPGDVLFDPLYHLPLGWLLREPGRFLIGATVAYGILCAATTQIALSAWQRRGARAAVASAGRWTARRPAFRAATAGLAACAVLLAPGYPLAFGQLTSSRDSPNKRHVSVPAYWGAMAGYLNSRQAASGSVLVLPADDFYQMPYTWGYYGNDGFITDMIERNVVDPTSQGYDPSSSELTSSIALVTADLLAHRWHAATTVLDAVGARDLLVRGDIDSSYPDRTIVAPARLVAALAEDPLVRLAHRDGPLELFRTTAPSPGGPVATVNSATPNLASLALLPNGTTLVTSPLRTGVTGVLQTPPLSEWSLRGNLLATSVATPPGHRYQLRLLASPGDGLAAGVVRQRPDVTADRTVVTIDLGPNLIGDGSFRHGAWQATVGNCDARPGVDSAGRLGARVEGAGVPGGGDGLILTAGVDTACESTPIAFHGQQQLLLSMEVDQHGGPGRICVWEANLGRCAAATTPMPSASGWQHYETVVTLDPGTSELQLFLYADAAAVRTTIGYGAVSVHGVAAVDPVLVAHPTGPVRELHILLRPEAYSPAWDGPKAAQHVLADGLRNAWVASTTAALAGTVRYRWQTPIELASLLSLTAAGVWAALTLRLRPWRWRRRRP